MSIDEKPKPRIDIGRRRFLGIATGAATLGVLPGVAVHRAFAYPTAATAGRFVMIFLRGGMDGLFAVTPITDPALAALRPNLSQIGIAQGIALTNTGFAAHPSAAGLAQLFAQKELAFCPTAGTTDKSRSHFQAQDLFELGNGDFQGGIGFMARLADVLQREHSGTGAISFTRETPLAFHGAGLPPEVAPLSGSGLKLPAGKVLDAIRAAHAGLKTGAAIDQAIVTQVEIDAAQDVEGAARGAAPVNGFPRIAGHMGRILKSNPRLSISFIDLGGFDTHANQEAQLSRALGDLSDGITALKEALGSTEWARTRVVLMSEFGRTARENGTRGTDHGHGGLFLLAGGNINGGRMIGNFSGLAPRELNDNRDLPALADWRQLLAETVTPIFPLPRAAMETVFPGMRKAVVGV